MSDLIIYHHGVKGMKWGIRRKRKPSGSSKSNGRKQEKSPISNAKSTIDKGSKQVARFLKDNKSTLIKSGMIVGLAAAGFPAASVAVSVLGKLKVSKQETAEQLQSAKNARDDAYEGYLEVTKEINKYRESRSSSIVDVDGYARSKGTSSEEILESLETKRNYYAAIFNSASETIKELEG